MFICICIFKQESPRTFWVNRCMWLHEERREAANTVSRCCWIVAPAPTRLSEIAAGPQASITVKKRVGTTRTSLDRDWRHTNGHNITCRHTRRIKWHMRIVGGLIKSCTRRSTLGWDNLPLYLLTGCVFPLGGRWDVSSGQVVSPVAAVPTGVCPLRCLQTETCFHFYSCSIVLHFIAHLFLV